jgi:hypothetical protein
MTKTSPKIFLAFGIAALCGTFLLSMFLSRERTLVEAADDMGAAFFREDAASILSRCPDFTFPLYGTTRAKFQVLLQQCLDEGRKNVKSFKRREGLTDPAGISGAVSYDVTLKNGRTVLLGFYAEGTESGPYYKPTRLLFAAWALEFFEKFPNEPPVHLLAMEYGLSHYRKAMEDAGIAYIYRDDNPKQTLAEYRERIRQGVVYERARRKSSGVP